MPDIPQSPEELAFGIVEIEKGFAENSRVWEEVSRDEIGKLRGLGYMVSSSLVDWDGSDDDGMCKGRCVQNFSELTEWWDDGSLRPAEFASQVELSTLKLDGVSKVSFGCR